MPLCGKLTYFPPSTMVHGKKTLTRTMGGGNSRLAGPGGGRGDIALPFPSHPQGNASVLVSLTSRKVEGSSMLLRATVQSDRWLVVPCTTDTKRCVVRMFFHHLPALSVCLPACLSVCLPACCLFRYFVCCTNRMEARVTITARELSWIKTTARWS